MYENYLGMVYTPFTRNVPLDSLYETQPMRDVLGWPMYVADKKLFAVVTSDPGCGKSTLLRKFNSMLPKDEYILLYLSDSKLTPKWFYKGLLEQLGMESRFYRGDAKRQLQKTIEIIQGVQKKRVVRVLDESHLLDKEKLEGFRFMLNYRFDSGLILVGQTEPWDNKLRLQRYAAIRQKIDMYCTIPLLNRAECGEYIHTHLAYAGYTWDIFTDTALDRICQLSSGIPRMINRICEKSLMYAYQNQKRLVDDHMVSYVADHEMLAGDA